MGGFSNKETSYIRDSLNNVQDNVSELNSTSFVNTNSININNDNNVETVDFGEFSVANEYDPYRADSGYTLDEIKDTIIELELSKGEKYIDNEIIKKKKI